MPARSILERQSWLAVVAFALLSTATLALAQSTGGAGNGAPSSNTQPTTGGQTSPGAGESTGSLQPGGGASQSGQLNSPANRQGLTTGGTVSPMPWFSTPSLRQQLNLNDQQFNQLNEAYNSAYQDYQQQLNQLHQQGLSPEQLAARVQALNQQFDARFRRGLNDSILGQDSRQRFDQLSTQYQGFGALSNPAVQQQLQLNADQLNQLRSLENQWNQAVANLRQTYGDNPEELQAQFLQLQHHRMQQLQGMLNNKQWEAWQGMTGQPYNFSINDYPHLWGQQNPGLSGQQTPGAGANVPGATPGTAPGALPGTSPGTNPGGGNAPGVNPNINPGGAEQPGFGTNPGVPGAGTGTPGGTTPGTGTPGAGASGGSGGQN